MNKKLFVLVLYMSNIFKSLSQFMGKTKTKNSTKKRKVNSKKTNSKKKHKCMVNATTECFLWDKNYDEFSQETKHALNDISIWNHNKDFITKIVGTGSSHMFKYPGDIDAMQILEIDAKSFSKLEDIRTYIEKSFVQLFQRIMTIGPKCVFIDFKAGLDSDYILPDSVLDSTHIINIKKLLSYLNDLTNKNFLTKEFYDYAVNNLKENTKYEFVDILRNLMTIRWNINDIITPFEPCVYWPNNNFIKDKFKLDFNVVPKEKLFKKFKLSDCLYSKQRVKLDVNYYIDKRWTEVTNIFIIKIINKGEVLELTENFDKYKENLVKDIIKYQASKNYLKVSKRLWNLSKLTFKTSMDTYGNSVALNKNTLKTINRALKFTKVFNINIAEMSQILADLEVLRDLCYHIKNENRNNFPINSQYIVTLVKSNSDVIVRPKTTLNNIWSTMIHQLIILERNIAEIIVYTGLRFTDFSEVFNAYNVFVKKKCVHQNKYICSSSKKSKNSENSGKNNWGYMNWIHDDIKRGLTDYNVPYINSLKDNIIHYSSNLDTNKFSNTLPPWSTNEFWEDYVSVVENMLNELSSVLIKLSKPIFNDILNKKKSDFDLDAEIEYLYTHL